MRPGEAGDPLAGDPLAGDPLAGDTLAASGLQPGSGECVGGVGHRATQAPGL